jgi:hypothetical protein
MIADFWTSQRPGTQLLLIEHANAVSAPFVTAEKINTFLGGGLDLAKMADAIDPTLHRNRARISAWQPGK